MADKVRLLLACSDPENRERLTHTLDEKFETIPSTNVEESSNLLAREPVSLVFCEDRLPGGGFPGLQNQIKRSGTSTPVVVLSRTGDWDEYLAVLRLGAFDMVIPPYERLAIQTAAYNALQESRVSRGARAVEALPRIGPARALQPAEARAFASAAGARNGLDERRTARERSKDDLPAAARNRTSEKETLTMCIGFAGSHDKIPDDGPAKENEGNSGIVAETGGITP